MGLFGSKESKKADYVQEKVPIRIEKELILKYRTRANTSLTDKKNIFLHYAEVDSDLAEKITQEILDFENGIDYAVWSAEDPESVPENALSAEISQMAVFIPMVTRGYLDMVRKTYLGSDGKSRFSLVEINDRGTAVLPIFMEADTSSEFNKLFGNMHGLYLHSETNPEKLDESLKGFLGDNELSEKIIKDAFSMNLFLSYRKKDRARALEIMKKIHDTETGKGASIWFDDFLVPGNDFNHQILEIMEQADAMVLSITPNVLEEGNYVKRIEYPEAKERMGKNIIPVEASETNKNQLSIDFPGIGQCVKIGDSSALNDSIKTVESDKKDREYSPFDYYLLGMAFLIGLRVEKDTERAIRLLEMAANAGIYQASQQLGFLYLSGKGVSRNHITAIEWYQKAFDSLKQNFGMERVAAKHSTGETKEKTDDKVIETLKTIYNSVYGKDGLFVLLESQNKISEAVKVGQEFIDLIETLKNDGKSDYEWYLWQAESYIEMGDLHFDSRITRERVDEAKSYLRKADDLLNSYIGNEKVKANILFAKYEYSLGEIRCIEGAAGAINNFERSAAILNGVIEKDNSEENRKVLSGVLGRLGLMQRDEGFKESLKNPFNSINVMAKAKYTLQRALVLERDLVDERPTIHNREGLAIALFNLALVEDEKQKKSVLMNEALDIVEKLQEETGDGSFNNFETQLRKVMKKLHVKRDK